MNVRERVCEIQIHEPGTEPYVHDVTVCATT